MRVCLKGNLSCVPFGSSEPAGGWSWITGEAFSYSNWGGSEPNNSFGTEDRITSTTGGWNDLTSTDSRGGFLVEFNTPSVAPEASPLALVALGGLVGVVAFRRRVAARSSVPPRALAETSLTLRGVADTGRVDTKPRAAAPRPGDSFAIGQ